MTLKSIVVKSNDHLKTSFGLNNFLNSFQTQGKGQAFVKKDEKNLKMIQKQSDQMMMGQRVLGQPYGDHLKKKCKRFSKAMQLI